MNHRENKEKCLDCEWFDKINQWCRVKQCKKQPIAYYHINKSIKAAEFIKKLEEIKNGNI